MFRQRLRSILALVAGVLACANAHAGCIVTGAAVIHVSGTNGNTTSLQVMAAGGTGACTSGAGLIYAAYLAQSPIFMIRSTESATSPPLHYTQLAFINVETRNYD